MPCERASRRNALYAAIAPRKLRLVIFDSQNVTLRANCMRRGSLPWLRITPKFGDVTVESGVPHAHAVEQVERFDAQVPSPFR